MITAKDGNHPGNAGSPQSIWLNRNEYNQAFDEKQAIPIPLKHHPHQILANYSRKKCDFKGEKPSRHCGDQVPVTGEETCHVPPDGTHGGGCASLLWSSCSKCTPSGDSWENSKQIHTEGGSCFKMPDQHLSKRPRSGRPVKTKGPSRIRGSGRDATTKSCGMSRMRKRTAGDNSWDLN